MKNGNGRRGQFPCPVEATLSLIGGKWKTVIIWRLKGRTLRYNQLMSELARISPKMLTKQLRELEEDGLIGRTIYPEIPPRVEYYLTDKGKSLIPIIDAMCQWGIENLKDRQAACQGAQQ